MSLSIEYSYPRYNFVRFVHIFLKLSQQITKLFIFPNNSPSIFVHFDYNFQRIRFCKLSAFCQDCYLAQANRISTFLPVVLSRSFVFIWHTNICLCICHKSKSFFFFLFPPLSIALNCIICALSNLPQKFTFTRFYQSAEKKKHKTLQSPVLPCYFLFKNAASSPTCRTTRSSSMARQRSVQKQHTGSKISRAFICRSSTAAVFMGAVAVPCPPPTRIMPPRLGVSISFSCRKLRAAQ